MKALLNLLLALIVIAYPFLVYWGLTRFQPRMLALMLIGVFGLRWVLAGRLSPAALKSMLPIAIAVLTTMVLVLIFGDGRLFLLHPVLINFVFLVVFALTLKYPPSMIERFARLRDADLPDIAIPYCRKVTQIWCVFFVVNASIALWTATMTSIEVWTLYNGLISYLLMGALFLGEWIVRRGHIRANQEESGDGKTLALTKVEPR